MSQHAIDFPPCLVCPRTLLKEILRRRCVLLLPFSAAN